MINIFRGAYIEAMNVRNLLESNDIEVYTLNEYMSNIEPWVVTSGGFNPVILKVNEEDLESAEKIIEDFRSGNLNLEIK